MKLVACHLKLKADIDEGTRITERDNMSHNFASINRTVRQYRWLHDSSIDQLEVIEVISNLAIVDNSSCDSP